MVPECICCCKRRGQSCKAWCSHQMTGKYARGEGGCQPISKHLWGSWPGGRPEEHPILPGCPSQPSRPASQTPPQSEGSVPWLKLELGPQGTKRSSVVSNSLLRCLCCTRGPKCCPDTSPPMRPPLWVRMGNLRQRERKELVQVTQKVEKPTDLGQ